MNQARHPIPTELLLEVIERQRIGAEYQPIKATNSLQTVGYEALARFYSATRQPLPPQAVFDTLHDSPITLVQVELMSKRWQIEHAPRDGLLFLNLDPHAVAGLSLATPEHPLLDLLCQPQRTVIELIENTNVQEADHSMLLAELLAQRGIRTALDDIGGPATMVSIPILCTVDIYKFDRQWLRQLQQPRQLRMLQMLLAFARAEGKQTVLEGVESEADLRQAQALGVDFVQGYLFRPEFIRRDAL